MLTTLKEIVDSDILRRDPGQSPAAGNRLHAGRVSLKLHSTLPAVICFRTDSPTVSLSSLNRTDGCGQFTNCNDCTWEYDDLDCGFCYTSGSGGPQDGACVPWSTEQGDQEAAPGFCQAIEGVERKFVGRYCPTVYSPMVLIGLCLYLISFQSGLGPVPWIVNAEVRIFIVIINTDNPFP